MESPLLLYFAKEPEICTELKHLCNIDVIAIETWKSMYSVNGSEHVYQTPLPIIIDEIVEYTDNVLLTISIAISNYLEKVEAIRYTSLHGWSIDYTAVKDVYHNRDMVRIKVRGILV